MAAKGSLPISKQSLTKIGICLLVIIVFVGVLLFPKMMEQKRINKEILQLEAEIERQKILYPAYIKLKAEMDKELVKLLPLPEPVELEESEVKNVRTQIIEIAEGANLQVNSVVPDPTSMIEHAGLVGINCDLFGEYTDFRTFMINVGEIASLRHMENLQVLEGGEGVTFSMRFQLAVKTEGES